MYSISKLVADATGNVVALDWSYSNEDGRLGNRWKLQQPYGSIPLEQVTEAVAVEWLVSQLPNDEEDFITALRKNVERCEYEATCCAYTVGESAPVRVIEPTSEEPEAVATADLT